MPPSSSIRRAGKQKGGTPVLRVPPLALQKELTSIFSKPSCGHSSRPSDARPSAACSSRYNRDHIAHPGRRSAGHLGRDRLGGHLGLHRGPYKPGSCYSRDPGRDRGPCPYLGRDRGPCLDLDLCHGRGMPHSVGPSVPMPKPNRR